MSRRPHRPHRDPSRSGDDGLREPSTPDSENGARTKLPESHWSQTRQRRLRARRRTAARRGRWRAGMYVSAVVVAAAGGVGLLARWASPSTEWLPQVAAPALPLLGPLSLPLSVTVATVAVRKKSPGGGLVALMLAAFFTAWASRTSPPPTTTQGPALRVVTLNLGESIGQEGALEAYIERTEPHLLLFQESAVSYGPYAPAIGRILATGRYTIHTDSQPEPRGTRRQVVLSRLPVLSYESGFLGSLETHSGMYGRAVVRWDGTDVAVYNVHLRPFNPQQGWSMERALSPSVWAETPQNLRSFFAEHAAEGEALASLIAAETGPVILGGDFNATPDQWGRAVNARRLREVTGRWRPGATRPDGAPLFNVDGIQVSTDWEVLDAAVGPGGLSDHRPVSASLVLGSK